MKGLSDMHSDMFRRRVEPVERRRFIQIGICKWSQDRIQRSLDDVKVAEKAIRIQGRPLQCHSHPPIMAMQGLEMPKEEEPFKPAPAPKKPKVEEKTQNDGVYVSKMREAFNN